VNNIGLLLILSSLLIAGCQTLEHRCQPNQSASCKSALSIWQANIDYIVRINFPQDYGKYKAVVWEEEFDNAWVTKGREINITKRFLEKLNAVRRICVAAHELSHLKMGHYYSRVGIIIVNSETPSSQDKFPTGPSSGGHYGSSPSIDLPEGFGINQEVEADRMALKLITQLGLTKNHYLDLLLLLQGRKVDPNTLIYHRIAMLKKL
jgi:beta-lactamase regulating signal transducer with metallopeptidase domain